MNLEHLAPADLLVGMVLPFDLYDKNRILLMSRGHTIASRDILRRILERGMYVDADELQSAKSPAVSQAENEADALSERSSPSAFDFVRGVRSDLGKLLLEPTSQTQFASAILAIASEIRDICQADGDAAIASIIADRSALYPIRHSVNTAILTELMLYHLEHDNARRLSAMAAALTMNIAMLRLQEILYHQSEPLSSEQKAAILAHPIAGIEQLQARQVTDEIWLRAVGQHHEQLDGKGYPQGLGNAQLTREGQVITIAERYCSMVSERGYRRGMLPNAVLKKLFVQSESLNSSLVELLVREVGIYPPGSYVRLINGELAIVLKRTAKAHQPLVRSLIDTQGEAIKEGTARDTSEPVFRVAAAVDATEVKIERDLSRLWTLTLNPDPRAFHKIRELRTLYHTVLDTLR